MKLTIEGLRDGGWIDERFAFCARHATDRVQFSDNRNPGVRWDGVPAAARSLVLVCVDRATPTRPDDVNKPDRVVPKDLPRTDFYHWLLVDIPPSSTGLDEGECSNGVVPRGKREPAGPPGTRQGINDYTGWFAGDPDMEGQYHGYDGPCPPWNDSIVHDYHFILYATDLDRVPLESPFDGAALMAAIDGHVLASAEVVGLYSLSASVSV